MRFVPGVELSANWRGQTIHIVGLEIDERHGGMQAHLSRVLERRQARLGEIGERLEKRARLPGRELAAAAATCAAPTRLHLARLLVARGFARDTQEAFDRWLNRDKPGHVPAEWPSLANRPWPCYATAAPSRCWPIRIAIGSRPGNCAS